jgi:hypothetical protein
MKNISPNSNDRLRIGLTKSLETFDTLIKTVKCPKTRRALESKAAATRAKVEQVRDPV